MINNAFDYHATINDSYKAINTLRNIKLGNKNTLKRIQLVLRPFKKFTKYIS